MLCAFDMTFNVFARKFQIERRRRRRFWKLPKQEKQLTHHPHMTTMFILLLFAVCCSKLSKQLWPFGILCVRCRRRRLHAYIFIHFMRVYGPHQFKINERQKGANKTNWMSNQTNKRNKTKIVCKIACFARPACPRVSILPWCFMPPLRHWCNACMHNMCSVFGRALTLGAFFFCLFQIHKRCETVFYSGRQQSKTKQ